MRLRDLTEQERRITVAAVAAIVNGPFIDDDEFHTVLGFDRPELREVHRQMLSGRDDGEASRAVGQSLNNLLGYPHNQAALVEKMVGCKLPELQALADKWFSSESK